jgi:antitoxin component of MazEF toxin-antitoxin module
MPQKVFKSGSGLAIILPKELARKYQIDAGTLVETVPTSEGLLVRPVEVVPRLSPEWQESLDYVLRKFRPALEKLGE